MAILKDFTDAVVKAECRKWGIHSDYLAGNGRRYDAYMDNASWESLMREMAEEHRVSYHKGGGKELCEKGGKPPKMASLVSSSRMIYMRSRDIEGFRFEEKRHTIVGGTANLDGFCEREYGVIYVEAKCREPYNHPLIESIRVNYRPVYRWLCERMPGVFGCMMEETSEWDMDVQFLCKGTPVIGFDVKQMICHLLGIGAYHLKQDPVPESICFSYLLYDPSELELPYGSGSEIRKIHRETCRAAEGFDFKIMFGHVLDYLTQIRGLPNANAEALKKAFEFKLVDQDSYGACF